MSEPPPQADPNLDPTRGSARDFGKGVLIVLVLVGLAYLAMMFQLAGPPGGPPPPGPPAQPAGPPPPQAGPPPAQATQAPPSTHALPPAGRRANVS